MGISMSASTVNSHQVSRIRHARTMSASYSGPSTASIKHLACGSLASSSTRSPSASGSAAPTAPCSSSNEERYGISPIVRRHFILSASSQELLEHFVRTLKSTFAIKDLGPVSYFLGVQVQRNNEGFLPSQSSYALDILERAGMANCKPVATPAEATPKRSSYDGTPLNKDDTTWYRSMAGAL